MTAADPEGSAPRGAPTPLEALATADVRQAGTLFECDGTRYECKGEWVGRGGTGEIWLASRFASSDAQSTPQAVAIKVLREEFLVLLSRDGGTRRQFEHTKRVNALLETISHPNLVPVLLARPVKDNFIFVTPLWAESLSRLCADGALEARDRVSLLIDGVRGLAALHARGIVHRDFTPNNILRPPQTRTALAGSGKTPPGGSPAATPGGAGAGDRTLGVRLHTGGLFDFDLAVCPELLPPEHRHYNGFYEGALAGSPAYSVAPELIDEALGEHPISPRIDVYAIGATLYALFTDNELYGEVGDLATLLDRISAGLVHRGESLVPYPADFPKELIPIIDRCLERDPKARFGDASEVLRALSRAAARLSVADVKPRFRVTLNYGPAESQERRAAIFATRRDPRLNLEDITRVDAVLGRHGYVADKHLGRAKGHLIFLARPDPDQLADGRFRDQNTYPKVVTVIDTSEKADPLGFAQTWLTRIWPILDRVRQGWQTALYNVAYDRTDEKLLLFSEYLAEARFGPSLAAHELSLEEALGLSLLITQSIARLHGEGLAHNNVCPEALLFQGRHELGEVRATFVGLVEPSFEPEAFRADVEQAARLVTSLIQPARVDALRADQREVFTEHLAQLDGLGSGAAPGATIDDLVQVTASALEVLSPNFGLLRRHEGNLGAYAELLYRHSLYNKLYRTRPPSSTSRAEAAAAAGGATLRGPSSSHD